MSKPLTIYEQLSAFWLETANLKQNTLTSYHEKLSINYNILDTFIANNMFSNESIVYSGGEYISNSEKNFIYNKNTICLLCPNYGLRIACTKSFIENIPFVKEILYGEWDKQNIFTDEYYHESQKEMIKGCTNIVIEDNTLDSILYESPIECRVREFERGGFFRIITVTCNNLLESIVLSNKL